MMNAGAYGGEMKQVVSHVSIVDEDGNHQILAADALQFEYRRSVLQRRPWIVVEIRMIFDVDHPERILARMSHNNFQREAMQPLSLPSAGSVFKRPPGKFVGPMIQQLGLKGFRIGGAQVSEKHAGFIVNRGGATAKDVLDLISLIRERVLDHFQVQLETEIRIIGEA